MEKPTPDQGEFEYVFVKWFRHPKTRKIIRPVPPRKAIRLRVRKGAWKQRPPKDAE